ncbi:Uncharacterised protein [Mycobacteroides abscessus subsp. abscessus]|uniref:hypothetical protein n=1 Tax=Mycobacteroides abscessus TaxID=36809 RepID=UPI0009282F1F|nr:hypothetical protein [Mycobacteroides abscessus]SHU27006.1 Uncharacterised protein [Mycobacteroides abscessus subsp. abscessus]
MTPKTAVRPNIFVYDTAVCAPDGSPLIERGPQSAVDLAKLVRWLGDKKGISSPTVWLLGAALAEQFGWLQHRDDKEATGNLIRDDIKAAFTTPSVTPAVEKASYRFTVYPHWKARERPVAEIVAARLGQLTDGHRGVLENLVTDDPMAEIEHRVQWVTKHLQIGATGPAGALGEALAKRTWKELPEPGVWPLGSELEPTRFEPSFAAAQPDPPAGKKIVVVDQRKAVLAAAGTVRLGTGTPRAVPGYEVDWTSKTAPATVVDVELPALSYLGVAPILRVHRLQQTDNAVRVPVCTRTVQLMIANTADGGLGMDVDDIDFGTAHVFPQTSTKLATWTKTMREAFTLAGDDKSIEILLKQIYQRTYMQFSLEHNEGEAIWQPTWSGEIRADVRARMLRYGARIFRDHDGLLPVAAQMDAWYYLVDEGFDESIFNDDSPLNGKYLVKEVRFHDPDTAASAEKVEPTPKGRPAEAPQSDTSSEEARGGLLHKLFGRSR